MDSYRASLEVLKWLPPRQALDSSVSRTWCKACNSPELWFLFLSDSHFPIPSSDTTPKDQYQRLNFMRYSLCIVRSGQLSMFHCRSGKWRPVAYLSMIVKCDLSSAFTTLYDGRVVTCGGGAEVSQCWENAYIIDTQGNAREIEHMKHSTMYHGIIAISNFVYIFGGKWQYSLFDYAARLDLSTFTWRELPKMLSGRAMFNPCAIDEKVFLCGGEQLNIDIFTTTSLTYTAVKNLTLPQCESASAVVADGSIIIVTNQSILKWQPANSGFEVLCTTKFEFVWGNQPGCIVDSRFYLPWGQLMQVFDINTGERKMVWQEVE